MSGKASVSSPPGVQARTIYRSHIGDSLSRCWIVTLLIAFFGLFGLSIVIGAVGPKATLTILNETPQLYCPGSWSDCRISYAVTFAEMKPANQVLLTTLTPQRPMLTNEQPALMSTEVSLTGFKYELDVKAVDTWGVITTILTNATHTADVVCPANQISCSSFVLFYLPSLRAASYMVSVRFINPFGPFAALGNQLQGSMGVNYASYTMNLAYANFTMGFRYFFIAITFLVWLVFTIFLCRGRKDERGNALSSSPEQKLVWWLSLFAIFFNDPLYAAQIFSPSFGTAFVNGVFTVTFVTFLLMFFAIHFHLAALQGEWAQGLSFTLSAQAAASRRAAMGAPMNSAQVITGLNHPSLGLCFWLPKVIFFVAFWLVSLTAFLYLRYKQLSDPAFGLWESVPGEFTQYILGLLYALATLYLLYVLFYSFLACRNYKRLRPSAKVFLFTTLTTLLLVLIGIYLDVFSPIKTTSASYLVCYATTNLYVLLLVFLYLPDNKKGASSLGEMIDEETANHGPVSTTLPGGAEEDDDDLSSAITDIKADVDSGNSTTGRKASSKTAGTAAVVTSESGSLPGQPSGNDGMFAVEDDEEEEEEGSSPTQRRA